MGVPKEPIEIKKQILELRNTWGSNSRIDWNSLAVWYGNRIPQYLWNAWREELRKKGFTWQEFLKLLRYRTDDALLWVAGKISWENFVKKILESLEGPLGEITRRSL